MPMFSWPPRRCGRREGVVHAGCVLHVDPGQVLRAAASADEARGVTELEVDLSPRPVSLTETFRRDRPRQRRPGHRRRLLRSPRPRRRRGFPHPARRSSRRFLGVQRPTRSSARHMSGRRYGGADTLDDGAGTTGSAARLGRRGPRPQLSRMNPWRAALTSATASGRASHRAARPLARPRHRSAAPA